AETAVIHEAIKLGIGVLKPVNDGLRYDLVLDIDEQLVRVQVKWAPRHGDVVVIRARSCRRTRTGLVHRPYTAMKSTPSPRIAQISIVATSFRSKTLQVVHTFISVSRRLRTTSVSASRGLGTTS